MMLKEGPFGFQANVRILSFSVIKKIPTRIIKEVQKEATEVRGSFSGQITD